MRALLIPLIAMIYSALEANASAQDGCAFELFSAPEAGLGEGAPLEAPGGLADGTLAAGSRQPDMTVFPYDRFRRLDTLVGGVNRYCTAQVIEGGDVLLTAAHCVQDAATGVWVSDFQLRSLAVAGDAPVIAPRCIVTPATWTAKPESFPGNFHWPSDYAFVVLRENLGTDGLVIGTGEEGGRVVAYGLPTGIGRHERLLAIDGTFGGDAGHPDLGLVAHVQADAGLGMSGGAWVRGPSEVSGQVGNVVVGLSAASFPTEAGFSLMGPAFGQCAAEMLRFAREKCSGD